MQRQAGGRGDDGGMMAVPSRHDSATLFSETAATYSTYLHTLRPALALQTADARFWLREPSDRQAGRRYVSGRLAFWHVWADPFVELNMAALQHTPQADRPRVHQQHLRASPCRETKRRARIDASPAIAVCRAVRLSPRCESINTASADARANA